MPKSSTPTRRAAIGAIAAAAISVPIVATASPVALPPADDPIFRASDMFWQAKRAHIEACEESDEAGDAACGPYCEAAKAFGRTIPATPLGAAVLLTAVREDMEYIHCEWHEFAIDSVIAGLQIMAGCDPDDVLPEGRREGGAQ